MLWMTVNHSGGMPTWVTLAKNMWEFFFELGRNIVARYLVEGTLFFNIRLGCRINVRRILGIVSQKWSARRLTRAGGGGGRLGRNFCTSSKLLQPERKCYKFHHFRNEQKFSTLFSILAQARAYSRVYIVHIRGYGRHNLRKFIDVESFPPAHAL